MMTDSATQMTPPIKEKVIHCGTQMTPPVKEKAEPEAIVFQVIESVEKVTLTMTENKIEDEIIENEKVKEEES